MGACESYDAAGVECPPEALGENAAVWSMVFTIAGWLIFRVLEQGELGNAREKLVISGLIVILIIMQVRRSPFCIP